MIKKLMLLLLVILLLSVPTVAGEWNNPDKEKFVSNSNIAGLVGGGIATTSFYYLNNRTLGMSHKLSQITSYLMVAGASYGFESQIAMGEDKLGGASMLRMLFTMAGAGLGETLFCFPEKDKGFKLGVVGDRFLLSYSF